MKKLLLIICMAVTAFGLNAKNREEEANIRVDKTNGGPSALINRYRNVSYTPVEGQVYSGHLQCNGDGFVACRVPRFHTIATLVHDGSDNDGISTQRIDPNVRATLNDQIVDAVNQLIEQSETEFNQGNRQGQASKTLAMRIPNTRGYNSQSIVAKWNYDEKGNGTVFITIRSGLLHFGRL